MLQSKQKRLATTAAILFTLLITAIWCIRHAFDQQRAISEQTLLLQQLQDGATLVVTESGMLLSDSQSLARIQQINDTNIANYQRVANGSVKQDLPAFEHLTGRSIITLVPGFDPFQTAVTNLIQYRTRLDRMLQGREQLIQDAERLATQAEGLQEAVTQDDTDIRHLRAVYQVRSILAEHLFKLREAYSERLPAPMLPLDKLEADLKQLSTDRDAPSSPAIRRSAANLLKSIGDHNGQLTQVQAHHDLADKIHNLQTELAKLGQTLQGQLETAGGQLYGVHQISIYGAIITSLLALGLTALLGFLLNQSVSPSSDIAAPEAAPVLSDKTSPHFLNQLKLEKNQLMNDIKPIGEGILYIKADEHMESTGDLARCLNQSREALIRRIDNLKRQALALQELLSSQQPVTNNAETMIATGSLFKGSLIELTLKGNAEIDGMQRRLRGLKSIDPEDQRQLLIRCLKSERIFDEIRVRLKKSDEGNGEPVSSSQRALQPTEGARTPDALNRTVEKLVEHLEEFQTQPQKPRRVRA